MELNKLIDHTFLKPEGNEKDIEKLCKEAREYSFKSVCVEPSWVVYAKELLNGSDVLICTVIGFPLGASTKDTKIFETKDALKKGADEIDMVMNISYLKAKKYLEVEEEIKEIAEIVHNNNKILKVIIECCLLTKDEIKKASLIVKNAGADFVKTSTGFSTGGAKVEDIKLIKNVVGNFNIKASGGIRDYKTAMEMIKNGATRLGVSSGVEIINESRH